MLKKDIYPLNVLKQTPYKLSFFPITTTFTTISYAFIILYLFAIESFIITNKILCLKISKFYSNSRTKPGRTHTIIIWSHESVVVVGLFSRIALRRQTEVYKYNSRISTKYNIILLYLKY